MFLRLIINDIKNSRLITFASFLIITVSALLFSCAITLILNLSTSIDNLMIKAETPHFMQMHSGNIDKNNLTKFAENNSLVQKYQTLDFLNIDSSEIRINNTTLADSIQDNGFSIQSKEFDYLLDLNNNIVAPKDGEIYLPLYLLKDKKANINDKATVCGKDFHVAGFIRDSQMNSLLASSKRFLVSLNDYNYLVSYGSVEYLIEFRLKDLSNLKTFENDYISSSLESNGPTITYPLFKMINSISDGLMIAIILLISFLILGIAFMCIRFTLLAKIEDDYYEIGVMKAIGLLDSEIKKIYLPKYAALSGIGCVIGYLFSIPIKNKLLKNIELSMGRYDTGITNFLLSIIGLCLIFFIIIIYVNHVLNRFKKVSAVTAMHTDFSNSNESFSNALTLNKFKFMNTNVFLGIKDVLSRKKLYISLLIIFILSSFIIIVPQNLYSSISSKDFITYMGIGDCDIRMDIQQINNIKEKSSNISKYMSLDNQVKKYSVLFEIYVNQTFGTTKSSVKTASYVSIVCSILISMFVSCLFIKMLISKDRYSIAIMKAIGFNNSHITIQYTTRSVFILVLGLIIGTILANTIGERIPGLLISFLGASSFKFSINPIITYVLCPAMLIMSVILSTILSTLNAGKIKLCESIKE